MASQTQDHSQDARHRLIEVALLAFAEKGFDGVGIREIAQKAETNPAMIAYHFGNKDGLYEAVLRWVISDFFQWIQNMQSAPAPNEPDAYNSALSVLRSHIKELFENIVVCNHWGGRVPKPHHEAAQKLWSQEMAAPRTVLLDFIIEQVQASNDRIHACADILRPGLSKLELDTMIIAVHGSILFFHVHFNMIQKMRGADFSKGELDALAQHFVDFNLRGLGVPQALAAGGH
jgi:AcrR family transcriptional regulator